MADIRKYIENNLLGPLKLYPTAIQDTLFAIISDRLEELYNYTILFPEIVSPNKTRLDILKVIANQFLFNIRDEADLQEQIDILDNILYVYKKRGSIETIENMWKYYGGDLPKEVQVIIPSYNLFRYNVSTFSGTHVFQDSDTNRTGVYEIKLSNSTYPIPKLREFLLKELVAAGNLIYFTNTVSSAISSDYSESYFKYDISERTILSIESEINQSTQGMRLSSLGFISGSRDSNANNLLNALWSGKGNIFVDLEALLDLSKPQFHFNLLYPGRAFPTLYHDLYIKECGENDLYNRNILNINSVSHCTVTDLNEYVELNLYNSNGERLERGYFILGGSLLNESLGYIRA